MKKEPNLKKKLSIGKKTVLLLTKSNSLYGGKTTEGSCACETFDNKITCRLHSNCTAPNNSVNPLASCPCK